MKKLTGDEIVQKFPQAFVEDPNLTPGKLALDFPQQSHTTHSDMEQRSFSIFCAQSNSMSKKPS